MFLSPNYNCTKQMIQITSWGMIDDLVFYPSDQLLLGEISEGELLLIESRDGSSRKFARLYGDALIAEPQKCRVSQQRWMIVGAVKGICRELSQASMGQEKWYLRFLNKEEIGGLDWLTALEGVPLDGAYIEELGRQLASDAPSISILAVWNKEFLQEDIESYPGKIIFHPKKSEFSSGFVSTWALASRRQMRRKWQQRRLAPSNSEQTIHSISSLKEMTVHNRVKEDKLASK